MNFVRIAAVVTLLAAVPALATVKKTTKKHVPAKKAHATASKKPTAKKKVAPTNTAIASAPRDEAKGEDSQRLAQADAPPPQTTGSENGEGEDGDVAPTGNRRVITHSTAAPASDTAQ